MKINRSYKGVLNGVSGVWCGTKPEGLDVIEERLVLYADEGYILQNIETNEMSVYFCIEKEEDTQKYKEIYHVV